ncbi:uncharacterized protein LOC127873131 [Dreissena polymorpha]|uniref:uncharacterized protein LOC127873131 n=1 Tax=Dreissena polymorpha TaxID=45954 RepID=UPI00226530A0|nr:uncharacterized protein LOC127873131 [Dreissena polymorpha]
MLAARWEGQFIVGVNPVQKILSFSIFQFEPNFSPEATKCLHHAKLTKDLANDIIQNMEQFEVSRQLRCDVNLTKVKQLYLYRPSAVSDIGCLVLETTEKPTFFQKWLHTSAEDKNKWHKRKDFFSKYKTVGNDLICIGGLMSELNELAALLLASDHDMEALYESGLHQTFRFDYNTQWTVIPSANESQNGDVVSKRIGVRKNTRNLGSNVQKLRKEIVAVLVNHNIAAVEHSDYDTHSKDVIGDKDCLNNEISLGIRVDDGVCPCLQDFVNFSCDSAIELNATLEKELQPRAFGFYEKDFDMSRVPGADIDRLKIGELISNSTRGK